MSQQFPPGFAASLLGQQQQGISSLPQGQLDAQFAGQSMQPDQARLWNQMQAQQQQQQQQQHIQMRPQQGQPGLFNGGPSQQAINTIRNHNFARLQNQTHMGQQKPQTPGFNFPQHLPAGAGFTNGPQAAMQNGMHQSFGNMGGMGGMSPGAGNMNGAGGVNNNATNGLNAMQMQLAQRNPAMLSQMIQNQGLQTQNQGRQLEMLLQQQGQQGSQGNQLALLRQRNLQQQIQQLQGMPNQQQQHPQQQPGMNSLAQLSGQMRNVNGGFFAGGGMPGNIGGNMGGNMNGIPGVPRAPSAQPNMHQQGGLVTPGLLAGQDGQDGQHRLTGSTPLMELRTRIAAVNDHIAKLKTRDNMLSQRLNSEPTNQLLLKERRDNGQEMHLRLALLQKLIQELQRHPAQQGNASDGHMTGIPQVSPLMANKEGQMQPNWMGSQVPAQNHAMMGIQQQQPQQGMSQPGPSQLQGMPQMPQQMGNNQSAQFPPGSAQMSFQQLPGAPLGNQASPNFSASQIASQLGNQFASQVSRQANGVQQTMSQQMMQSMTKPLSHPDFQRTYEMFCKQRNVVLDQALMMHEGRMIDLYALHREVLGSGSFEHVTKFDLWPVIGAKLGFVQLPASESEPAKSGPALAERLKTVYERYLFAFDTNYQRSYASKMQAAQMHRPTPLPSVQQNLLTQQSHMGGTSVGQNAETMQQQPSPHQPTVPELSRQLGLTDLAQIKEMLMMSTISTQELQKRGVQPEKINFVETHRATMQRWLKAREDYQRTVMPSRNGHMGQTAAPGQFQNQQVGAMNQGAGVQNLPGQQQSPQTQQTHLRPGQQGVPQPSATPQQGASVRAAQPPLIVPLKARNGPPTPQEKEQVRLNVEQWKREAMDRIAKTVPKPLPERVRNDYVAAFQAMTRLCHAIDQSMHVVACFLPDDYVKKLCTIIVTTRLQTELLTKPEPAFIMEPQIIGASQRLLAGCWEATRKATQGPIANGGAQNAAMGTNGSPANASLRPPSASAPVTQSAVVLPLLPQSQGPPSVGMQQSHLQPPRTPQPPHPPVPQPSQVSLPPQQSPSHFSPVPSAQPVPSPSHHLTPPAVMQSPAIAARTVRKPPHTPTAAQIDLTTTSTPPPNASTPVVNAATPVHIASSPQAPKSPKTGKAQKQTRPAPTKRKPATGAALKAVPTQASDGQPPTPTAATLAEVGQKRPREEDAPVPSASAIAAQEPSPKRIKTEWDGPKEESLTKKEEQVDGIKTEEDATRFFEEVSTLLKRTLDENPSGLSSEISDSLGQILKGYSQPPELDLSGFGALSGGDNFEYGTSPAPLSGQLALDEYQFFDFSSFDGADDDNKAETPDLVQASSTKTSPGSASEMDGLSHTSLAAADTAKIADTKEEEMDESDPLRLGFWREIDGGEAPYFQPSEGWKWDGTMPTSEQPWAISTA